MDTIRRLSRRHSLPLDNSPAYLEGLERALRGEGGMPVACNAPYTSLVIGPDLHLYTCFPHFETSQPFARWDPEGATLGALWNSRPVRERRRELSSCRECFWNCHAEINYMAPMPGLDQRPSPSPTPSR